MQKKWDEWDDTEDATELELRLWLGMVPWDWNIKKNLAHFVHKLHDMLTWMEKFAEKHPKTKGTRLYSLLPYSSSYLPYLPYLPYNHIYPISLFTHFLFYHITFHTNTISTKILHILFNRDLSETQMHHI
jgi:hypothetical protein